MIPPLIAHALLALALLALLDAGRRVAGTLGAAGLQRLLAAIPLAATGAGLSALALGLVGLGSDPFALTLAAGGIWLAAERFTAPAGPAWSELAESLARLPAAPRVGIAAAAGALVALVVWLLQNPALVGDGLQYHVPLVAAWVTGGEPGSIQPVSTDAPLEAYPLSTELLATWATGIARSFVPVTLSNPLMLALIAFAGWVGLRELRVPRSITALAVAALASAPLLVSQLNTFTTDVPALAWLVCCAALCVGALRAPGLLVPAVLAGGIAIGTKTTALPLAAGCLIVTAIAVRGGLRPWRWALGAAVVAAAVVGGLWYFRNLILHGSPLWPFVTTPWGDESSFLFDLFGERVLFDPSSADGRWDDYGRYLYGGVALLAGGVLAPIWSRSPRVVAASLVTLASILIWASAPNTAFPDGAIYDGLQGGAIRYLLPGVAAGAVALALAATERGIGGGISVGVLAAALLANLVGDARLGFVSDFQPVAAFEVNPVLPSALVPLAGAAAGALLAGAALRLRSRRGAAPAGRPRPRVAVAVVAGSLLAGGLLALAASGYVERSSGFYATPAGARWLIEHPGYLEDDEPVASQSRIVGTLAGDELRHRLTLLDPEAGCERVRESAGEGWVIFNVSDVSGGTVSEDPETQRYALETRERELAAARCLDDREPAYSDAEVQIYAPGGPSS